MNLKIKKNKKTIIPIIGTLLLITVTIGVFISLNSWFLNTNSSFFTSFYDNSSLKNFIKVDDLRSDSLYLYSSQDTNLTLLKIYDSNQNLKCEFSGILILKKSNQINISSCNLNQAKAYNIFGFDTNGIIFENNLILK